MQRTPSTELRLKSRKISRNLGFYSRTKNTAHLWQKNTDPKRKKDHKHRAPQNQAEENEKLTAKPREIAKIHVNAKTITSCIVKTRAAEKETCID